MSSAPNSLVSLVSLTRSLLEEMSIISMLCLWSFRQPKRNFRPSSGAGWLLTRYLTDSLRAMLSCSRPPSRRQVVGRFTLMKIGQLSVSLCQLELAVGLCCCGRRRLVREFISFRVVCFDFFLLMKGFDLVYVLWSVGLFVDYFKGVSEELLLCLCSD